MRVNAVNLVIFTNALCHFNATPLSVAVLAPCACGRNRQSENGSSVWAGTSLSLSRCSHLWHAFGLNLKSFFTHFIVVLTHLFTYKRHFLGHCAFLNFLNALFLGFLCLSLRAVFAKTAWQSINLALFLLFGLPRSFCSLAMTARLVILSLLQKGDPTSCKAQATAKKSTQIKENLPFLDTSLTLSMTNLDKSLNLIVCHTQILKQKFKAFYKFNSFYNFISNFKPYTRLLHIFTPNFLYFHSNRFQKFEKFNTK